MSKALGSTQRSMLKALKEHKGWSRGCGWLWDTHSNTVRILDSLVKRGLANFIVSGSYPRGRYVISVEGEKVLSS